MKRLIVLIICLCMVATVQGRTRFSCDEDTGNLTALLNDTYVNITGDTMTGMLTINSGTSDALYIGSGNINMDSNAISYCNRIDVNTIRPRLLQDDGAAPTYNDITFELGLNGSHCQFKAIDPNAATSEYVEFNSSLDYVSSETGLYLSKGATSSGFLRFLEDSDNGTNYTDVYGASAMTTNYTITLPAATGTVALTSDLASYATTASLNSYAYMYSTGAGATPLAKDAWTKLNFIDTDGTCSTDFDVTTTVNRIVYTGTATRNFVVVANMSFWAPGQVDLQFALYKNGVLITGTTQWIYDDTAIDSDSNNFSLNAGVSLATNDYIEIYVVNTTDGTDCSVDMMTMTVR